MAVLLRLRFPSILGPVGNYRHQDSRDTESIRLPFISLVLRSGRNRCLDAINRSLTFQRHKNRTIPWPLSTKFSILSFTGTHREASGPILLPWSQGKYPSISFPETVDLLTFLVRSADIVHLWNSHVSSHFWFFYGRVVVAFVWSIRFSEISAEEQTYRNRKTPNTWASTRIVV